MYRKLKIVKIDNNYCNYLRRFDSRVTYNDGNKKLRPFVGVLFIVNKCYYFAPLSSPKEKHKYIKNTLDMIKIKNGELGVINLNNMIPVTDSCYVEFKLNKKNYGKSKKRIELMNNQIRWITINRKEIYLKSRLLYNLYSKDKLPENVKLRCCNYKLLEEKCKDYSNMI